MMTRAVLTIDLHDDPDTVAAYRRHHARIWPEVAASLYASGVRRMEIFLLGCRLVTFVETDGRGVSECFAVHHASRDPRVAEWEALMKSMQRPAPGAAKNEWWAQMECVFELNAPRSPRI
jgi:L-rhamnose mutarotase